MHSATDLNTELNLQLLIKEYHRINYQTSETIELDDCKSMVRLLRLADAVDLSETEQWLHDNGFDEEDEPANEALEQPQSADTPSGPTKANFGYSAEIHYADINGFSEYDV